MLNFSNPRAVLEQLGIGESSVVVDLGSGSGHYSLAAAEMSGNTGHVYAVDVQKDLLEKLQESAREKSITSIDIIHADIEQVGSTKLQDSLADVVLLCNTLFQLEDKKSTIQEAKRILRPRGRLLVVDWTDSHGGLGPDASLIFSQQQAEEILVGAGFEIEKELNAGAHHYGFISRTSHN